MASDRRLEIFGILIIAVSVFILFSFLGYNPNEEPSISPNVKIENPMGILGLIISHVFVKLGFGYVMIFIPIFGMLWGWTLFAKKNYENLASLTSCCKIYLYTHLTVIESHNQHQHHLQNLLPTPSGPHHHLTNCVFWKSFWTSF